ncbi:hypothetical protein FHY52_04530, partial [Nocardia nova]|nr:hypothetical protein [Nocardia nova]
MWGGVAPHGSEVSPPMTTQPVTAPEDRLDRDRLVTGLRIALFGPDPEPRARVRAVVTGLGDVPRSGLTEAERAAAGPRLLRAVLAELGPGERIATDVQLRGVLCEEAAIGAPRLLPVLTGHFDLAMGAIMALGNGSAYQRDCLSALSSGDALGVLMLTETGGANGADHRLIADMDSATRTIRFHSADMLATSFMPNVAACDVSTVVVVAARLLVDGEDNGVFLFVLRLRDRDGLAEGVEVVRLPDNGFDMDNAITRFSGRRVPADALLGGTWARVTEEGRLDCSVPLRRRFHDSIVALGDGRLDLAGASIAAARAAVASVANFAAQRVSGAGTRMIDRDAVEADLVDGVVSVVAASVLVRQLRVMRAGTTSSDGTQALWSMLAKPALTLIAHRVLSTCRLRAAAHGTLDISRLTDWHTTIVGAMIAEGETQVLQVKSGTALSIQPHPVLPGTPDDLPPEIQLLVRREVILAERLRCGDYAVAGPVLGPGGAAIALSTATAERALAVAPLIAATTTDDP